MGQNGEPTTPQLHHALGPVVDSDEAPGRWGWGTGMQRGFLYSVALPRKI